MRILAAPTRRLVGRAIMLAIAWAALASGCAPAQAAGPALAPRADGLRDVCPPAATRRMRCNAIELTAPGGLAGALSAGARSAAATGAAQTPECRIPLASEGCYGLRPRDLRSAYELPQSAPDTQTIAIVTAGGDPRIGKDLANYDREFQLQPCASETACPEIVNGEGKPRPLPAAEGEAPLETSLDIEMAHAVCPGCDLLLVEAGSSSLAAFEQATDTAARLGADEISISWGEAEPEAIPEAGAAFDHPGTVITAPAGDSGYLNWASVEAERGHPEYPASSPDVIAVGGTSLELGAAGEWQDEQVWNQLEPRDEAGGSGCSTSFEAPAWQLELPDWEALGCGTRRATADIGAVADPRLGVAVYDSNKDSEGHTTGWRRLGGTSAGAPLIAAAFALAGGAHGVAYPAQTLYGNAARDPGLLHDITVGTNGACTLPLGRGCTADEQAADCASRPICAAGPGYDGPTGVGSLRGIAALEPPVAFRTSPPQSPRRGDYFAVEAVVDGTGAPVQVESATPSVCSAAAGRVALLAAGTCTLTAGGNGYLQAQQSFAVARTLQNLAFSSATPIAAVAGGGAYLPAASASSGLPVTLLSLTPSVCAVQGGSVAPLAAGLCTIAAEQPGDGDYEPAQAAMQSYTVAAAPASGILAFGPAPFAGTPALQLRAAPTSSRRNGTVTLALALASAGTLRWQLTFTGSSRCAPRGRSCARQIVSFAAGRRALAAGPLRLSLRPGRQALRELRARRVLRVRVLLTLEPTSGAAARVSATTLVRLSPSR